MLPETRYAKSGDIQIAYQITGSGPVDIVLAPGTASHLDLDWEWPPRGHFFEDLSSFCRLIRFDKRGTGLSDRPTQMATLEERTDDIRAVMDAAGSTHATVFGVSEGGSMACLFAATYPERTRSLMVWGAQARWVKSPDYPWGLTREEDDRIVAEMRERGATVEYLTGPGAGLGKDVDPAFLAWYIRYARAAASPSALAAYEEMNADIDIRGVLPSIRVPTLVMNRTGDPVANVEAARDLAARISGARFVDFPGNTHSIYAIEPEKVLAVIEEFVTGTRAALSGDRVLATVLFVDVVGSTERAVQLGDAAWRNLLETFYVLVRKEVARFRGSEVDTAGDGFFATFDGPARAIGCACSIRDAVTGLGIQVRAGLHTGECERIGAKIGGVAVHIGARVMAQAAAGQVLVSSTVKDLVAGSGIQFAERGSHELKGVPGEWHLFAVER